MSQNCFCALWLLVVATFFEASLGSNDTNSSTEWECNYDWDVDFVGKSGQFKIFPCDDSNFFIKVKLQRITDGSNSVNSFSYASADSASQSSGNGSVYGYQDADGNDITLGGVTLNYDFDVDDTIVAFTMNVLLIDDVTIISYKNTTHELSQGTIKFDFSVENWPFSDDSDDLSIELKLTTGGTTNDGEEDDEDSDSGTSKFSWGDEFVVEMPDTYAATVGNDTEARDTTIDFDANGSGKQVDITFTFVDAGDASKIMYDPWISGSITGGSGSQQVRFGFAMIALIVAAVGYML